MKYTFMQIVDAHNVKKPFGWWQYSTPSGPTTAVILVVDYTSKLSIHSVYVHPFCVKEMYTSFIVILMQHIVHNWYRRN